MASSTVEPQGSSGHLEINALTLAVRDMAASVRFYIDVIGPTLGLFIAFGGPESRFSTVSFGANFINLQLGQPPAPGSWGRTVLHVPDPDAVWRALVDADWPTETEPADAPWGERYFHVRDPDGHELSFARRL